jgi:DNA adenine methylase
VRYMGGKTRIAGWISSCISSVVEEYRGSSLTYVEAFMGSGAVLEQVVKSKRFSHHIANDIHPDLIRMWHALSKEDWDPPPYVTRAEHRTLRNSEVSALRGYVGFNCSYRGVWFGGIKGPKDQRTDRGIVLRTARSFRSVEFRNVDYRDLIIPLGSIVYCDPPYANTCEYSNGAFEHRQFWRTMDQWVERGAIVFVSEYEGPWPIFDEMPVRCVIAPQTRERRMERLFMRRP